MDYVFGLDREQLNDIALYLNFTMLGSPTPDSSPTTAISPARPDPVWRRGCARRLGRHRAHPGRLSEPGRQATRRHAVEHPDRLPPASWLRVCPIGGMTTGASQPKTPVQARLWGGQAGVAFDPNFQSPRDTVDNINREALAVMGSGVGFAVGSYAESIGGVNGVPPHDKRHRTRMP